MAATLRFFPVSTYHGRRSIASDQEKCEPGLQESKDPERYNAAEEERLWLAYPMRRTKVTTR